MQLVAQCETSVLELPEGSKSRVAVLGLLEHFKSYRHYDQCFNPSASTPGTDCEDRPAAFATMRADLCKMGCAVLGRAVLDFFSDLFANEFDNDLNELIKKHTGAIATLQWQALNAVIAQSEEDADRGGR